MLKTIKGDIKKYFHVTVTSMQCHLCYKSNFIMESIAEILKVILVYYLVNSLYENSSSDVVNGFASNEILTYVFLSSLTVRLVGNTTDQIIGNEVWNGTVANNLLKPINYKGKLLFQAMSDVLRACITVAIPFGVIMLSLNLGLNVKFAINTQRIGWYLISTILGFLIYFLINFIFGLMSFYVTNIWGIRNLKNAILNFFMGSIIPLSFFPMVVQKIMNFLPFQSVSYTPVFILMGKISVEQIGIKIAIQIIWIMILWGGSVIVWNRALKKLVINGG